MGYLDFHTHILPGIDDGSRNWEMTKRMLIEAYYQGVRTLVATPHNYPSRKKQDNEEIRRLCQEADKLAKEIDPAMRVLPGNEIYYRMGILEELENGNLLTMADSSYLLVEFSPEEAYQRIYQGTKELIEAGFFPVIAHIERVNTIIGNKKHLEELAEMGNYMQANCESLLGGFFQKQSVLLRDYLKKGYLHFLGSDCHNLTDRRPIMEDCVLKLRKKVSQSDVDRLILENPIRFLEKKFI